MLPNSVKALLAAIENFADRLCDRFPTRRERIATALAAGMLSHPDGPVADAPTLARDALVHADALIAALDK